MPVLKDAGGHEAGTLMIPGGQADADLSPVFLSCRRQLISQCSDHAQQEELYAIWYLCQEL